jgi:hypothetical protein
LADLNYLVDKKYYGKRCEPDSTIDDELKSLSEVSVSRDDGADAGAGDDEEATARGYYIDYSSTGSIDDIPEKNRNIYFDINTNTVFDSQTIENATHFDNILNQLVSCGIHDKKPRVDFKQMKVYLKRIYDKRLYYILNDLCYFKDYKIGKQHCFIQYLLSNEDVNTNLLENMRLLTTQEFNSEYLAETEDAQKKIASLISSKDEYLSAIDSGKYQDYSGKPIDKKMVDDILGFLYESERYSLYLYLIDEENPQPVEGKKIIVTLYETVINQKNDKVESVFGKLTDSLTSTLMRSEDKSGEKESKLMESLKKGAIGATIAAAATTTATATETTTGDVVPVGPKQLLKAVEYVNQRSNCDGNCFYNSIGMLSSGYMVMKEEYDKYVKMSLKDQYDVQFQQQTRVRGQLADFLTKIYKLIEGKVDVTTRQYKNSPILKYIMRNGKRNFKYVRKISKSVGYKYYGSDEEIYFASLLYLQPIITVIGVSDNNVFNIFYWDSYMIDGVKFEDYISQEDDKKINVNGVIDFLIDQNRQYSYLTAETSKFLLNHPSSYLLVGGRGHWTYAVNKGLLTNESVRPGAGASEDVSEDTSDDEGDPWGAIALSGGNAPYKVRTTKKIKNKYYKKELLPSSSSSSLKTTKKHKKTRRMNKNKKRIKKTIKL